MKCLECNNLLKGQQTKFCCIKCKTSFYNKNYKAKTAQEKGRTIKYYLVIQRGGKCEKCGYNKNLAALTFHHINPKTKKFKLDQRSCANYSLNKLLKEFSKCMLLCANCHAEEHNENLDIALTGDFNSKELLKKWVNLRKAKL